jgi:hypothetical protein
VIAAIISKCFAFDEEIRSSNADMGDDKSNFGSQEEEDPMLPDWDMDNE